MEKIDLTSESFWVDLSSHVFVNEKDARAVGEAEILRRWLDGSSDFQAHLFFSTSGSTGKGKWIALSKQAMLHSAKSVNQHLAVTAEDRWLLALPTFHVGGMGIMARAYLASCQVIESDGKWDAVRYCDLLHTQKITLSSLVPAQLVDLVRLKLSPPATLRAVLIGGGRLSDDVYNDALKLGWNVMETYGMTEAASQIATSKVGLRKMSILPHWKVKIDDENRLAISGDALLSAMMQVSNNGVKVDSPKQNGWFYTSDCAQIDGRMIQVKGRVDRCVKVLGELVNLEEVERYIEKNLNPDFAFVVLPINDERAENKLLLCSEKELVSSELLDDYNRTCPALFRVFDSKMLPIFPRSPLGKIKYVELLRLLKKSYQQGCC